MESRNQLGWQPQPRQRAFMARREYEALYGGAAGGGKSDALVIEALRQVHIPNYKALILRKTFPETRELIDKSLQYYKQAFPTAKYNGSAHLWTFPSGAKIYFGSLNHTQDRLKYSGLQFDFIAFDELTMFTWDEYSFMFSRNRPSGPGTRVYIRSTANPGGVGHGWVKERFITAAPPMTPIPEVVKWKDPDGVEHERTQHRIFVPARLFDNQALMTNDPNYVTRLASMPTALREALLDGSWDSFSGQVFTDFRNDPAHYQDRKYTHVIDPFRIPDDWAIWCGLDWGYSRPFSVGWFAVDRNRRMYHIRELYGCRVSSNGLPQPNTGVMWEPTEVAKKIRAIEEDDPNLRGRTILRVGDPAIWGSDGTESIGALFERQRVYFERGDNARIDGKMQVHHRLSFDEDGVPMLYVFKGCRNFIRTFPNLVYDETDVEDVDTDGEDHAYDMLRYVCMRNPIAPRRYTREKIPEYDPLDLWKDKREYDPYAFYTKKG